MSPGYEEMVELIDNLPDTWMPAILIHVVETCVKKNVFVRSTGLLQVVAKANRRAEEILYPRKEEAF